MEIKVTLSRDEVKQLAKTYFEKTFGQVPEGHDCEIVERYGRMEIEVSPKPEPPCETNQSPGCGAGTVRE
ncbi:MAG: hypothetical protein EHM35_12835 [Planctomycetaceae bacterium]|nr:MAG: hypothetical protein EHM35_12835 [Planctomycetaceae bacterium]